MNVVASNPKMVWKKLGRIFKAEGQFEWMRTHTSCPIPVIRKNGNVRVYFGTRDVENHSHIAYLEFCVDDPLLRVTLGKKPVLSPGPTGSFDEHGVYPGSIVAVGSKLLMYYAGRSNGEGRQYSMSIGLAESDDGGLTFNRIRPEPLLQRGKHDPWMVSTPHVMYDGKQRWRMWYLSGIGWKSIARHISLYHVKYAESVDGRNWRRDGKVAFELEGEETNIASPYVWMEEGEYRAIYCVARAHEGYRLAEAASDDGVSWRRYDCSLNLSEYGWDSNCLAYPSVFECDGRRFLLYCGNDNGKGGMGLAEQLNRGDIDIESIQI